MDINEIFISISIALTIPFLCYCVEILYVWWPSVKQTFQTEDPVSAAGHLARGIWIGFAANLLDNMYWLATWTLILFQHPIGLLMMLSGALANIFFRQIGGLMAAREHALAAAESSERERDVRPLHKYYWFAGLLTFVILITV